MDNSGLIRAVQLEHEGRRFTFYVDEGDVLAFWRVTFDGKVWRAPISYTGNESPGFFRALAKSAMEALRSHGRPTDL